MANQNDAHVPGGPRPLVLVAVDTSSAAEAIVRRGAQLAASMQASLHLVQVVELLPLLVLGNSLMVPGSARLIQQGWLEIDRLLAIAQLTVSETRGHVVVGHPAARIAELATTLGAEVLVVGTHDAGKLKTLLFGSVATELARMAPCPVFIVRGRSGSSHPSRTPFPAAKEPAPREERAGQPGGNGKHPLHALAEKFRREHGVIARRCADLVQRAGSGDWHECDAIWEDFCTLLDVHMVKEEAWLLPVYEQAGESEARTSAAIREEHDEIRREVERLGLAVQVHSLRADDIEALVRRLDEHGQREDRTLHAWLEAQSGTSEARVPLAAGSRSQERDCA